MQNGGGASEASASEASVTPASVIAGLIGPHLSFVQTLPGLQSPFVWQASFTPADKHAPSTTTPQIGTALAVTAALTLEL
jgi:hypothetical protein